MRIHSNKKYIHNAHAHTYFIFAETARPVLSMPVDAAAEAERVECFVAWRRVVRVTTRA